jgi:hypothetical protein
MNMHSMGSFLPQEILEVILGFAETETLRTARMVSKSFCAAALTHVCRVSLSSTSEVVPLHRFPHLGSVNFVHYHSEERLADIAPGMRDLITTARTSGGPGPMAMAETLTQLAAMPRLRELDVEENVNVRGPAPLLRHLTNLEIIRFGDCGLSVATTLVTLTLLTQLWIGAVYRAGWWGELIDVFSG